MKKIIIRIGVFALTLVLLWAAIFVAALIPNDLIYENMHASSVYYSDKDAFAQNGEMRKMVDNYADTILLNVAWNMGYGEPFVSCLDTKYFDGNEDGADYGENWGLYCAVTGKQPANTDYTRYWHGMTIFVRLFMIFTDVNGIKLIWTIAAFVLLAINCAILIKKRQFFAAGALLLSFISVHIWNISLALEYQPAIIITLAILPFFITLEKRGDDALTILAIISGVLIAFFDFLTAETLTILIPLAVVFTMRKKDERFGSFKENFITLAKCGAAWFLSYAGTFLAKWTLASAVTGENKFLSAISSAEIRFIGETEELSSLEQFFLAPLANLSTLFGGTERVEASCIILGLILSAVVLGIIFFLFHNKNKFDGSFSLIMLIIALLPFARYFALNNHSYLHEYFTYRALAATILAVFAIVWFTLDFGTKSKTPQRKGKRK